MQMYQEKIQFQIMYYYKKKIKYRIRLCNKNNKKLIKQIIINKYNKRLLIKNPEKNSL